MINNDTMVNDITDYFNTNDQPSGGATTDQDSVSKAWDLAKSQIQGSTTGTTNTIDPKLLPDVITRAKQLLNPMEPVDQKQDKNTSMFRTPPTQPTPSTLQQSYKREATKDLEYMEWKERSSELLAVVRFLIQEKLYIMEFKNVKEGQSSWNYEWNTLLKQGISNVVTVTIEQLNGDINNQKISVNKNNMYTENKDALFKAMLLAFQEYFKMFNKAKDVQYIMFTAETQSRFIFMKEFIKKFHTKYTNFSEVEEISKLLSKNIIKILACRNSSAKLKEEDGGSDSSGTVSSDAFDASPFDAGRTRKDWKKDWDSQVKKGTPKKEKRYRVIDTSLIKD